MRIRLLAIGNKLPKWVEQGFLEYAKRLPPSYPFELIEIPAEKRNKSRSIVRLIECEGQKLLAAVKPHNRIIALDLKGQSWSTEKLSHHLDTWQQEGRSTDFLIGGPDGLSKACLTKADILWSLSALTLPHALARLLVIEQLYRAISILQKHPYHRA